jgi:hypothetical protein
MANQRGLHRFSNGDRPEFFVIFDAAVDAIGITDRRMIDSSFRSGRPRLPRAAWPMLTAVKFALCAEMSHGLGDAAENFRSSRPEGPRCTLDQLAQWRVGMPIPPTCADPSDCGHLGT